MGASSPVPECYGNYEKKELKEQASSFGYGTTNGLNNSLPLLYFDILISASDVVILEA